jgi:hypothetical protein
MFLVHRSIRFTEVMLQMCGVLKRPLRNTLKGKCSTSVFSATFSFSSSHWKQAVTINEGLETDRE